VHASDGNQMQVMLDWRLGRSHRGERDRSRGASAYAAGSCAWHLETADNDRIRFCARVTLTDDRLVLR
jgi:hypothetical protein